ncbi:hypothetical protein LCGC14_0677540 [marine sediment metagenome]|uniref:Uncharacterized protein n=1 Tax=marine sediment metagenome TaxID=412755 RepID=A0A0F9QP45_9ZZZZ|nr:hypothetical protein [Methylophaga sp.]
MNNHIFIYIFLVISCLVGCLVSFVLGTELGLSVSIDDYERSIIPALSLLGSWLGAFATSAAVVVSLWLAFKQLSQDKEILDSHLNMVLIPGIQDSPCIGLQIVSKGNRPANIRSISWFGEGAKHAMWVKNFHRHSDTLPKTLSYGEQLNLIFTPNFEVELANYVHNEINGKFENLYLSLSTSTETKKINISKSMQDIIRSSQKTEII